ncbi:acyltransferase [Paraburkholderia sp. J41]|uniref:acyltransferase family protein n=1 Tax=Paraburkholderia sp. J41 TaxID=2805433 RepID=UPI002AC32D64|nr:acyltransferase [Paraburkholderia sp. J41]
MNKLRSLTVLRAIAATTVIVFHILVNTAHTFGQFGVDIFFVLSGFVIALVLDSRELSVGRFLADRIARIVPLYWLLTCCVFAGTLVAPALFNSTTADFGNLLRSLFFVPYRKESGELFPMLFVGWTLNYEMMFYLVAALSLVLMRRYRLLFAAALLAAIFCAARAFNAGDALSAFYSSQRIFEFPLGFIAWRLWRQGFRLPPALAAGVAVLAYACMAYVDWNAIADFPLLCFGIPAFLMVMAALSLEASLGNGPLTRGFVFVGDASYAIYLSHPYCVEAARRFLPKMVDGFDATAPLGAAFIVAAAIAVGGAMYRFVDAPLHAQARTALRRWLKRPARASAQAAIAGSEAPQHNGPLEQKAH